MSHDFAAQRLAGAFVLALSAGFSTGAAHAESADQTVPKTQLHLATGPCLASFTAQPDPKDGSKYMCQSVNQIGTLRDEFAPVGLWGCRTPYRVKNSSPTVQNGRFIYECMADQFSVPYPPGGPCFYPGYANQKWPASFSTYRCGSAAPRCKTQFALVSGSPSFNLANRRFRYHCLKVHIPGTGKINPVAKPKPGLPPVRNPAAPRQ